MKFSPIEEQLMGELIELAAQKRGMTAPNPMVAAGIVKDGRLIASAVHEAAGFDHAEVALFKQVLPQDLKGATLMVTLEPCTHHGKTPPCVDQVLKSGVSEVIVATLDPNPLVKRSPAADSLNAAGITYRWGCLWEKAVQLNAVYLTNQIESRAFLAIKIASSLDGKVALSNGKSQYLTGEKSLKRVHQLRAEYAAICVGIYTVIADQPQLTIRHGINAHRVPYIMVIDPMFRYLEWGGSLHKHHDAAHLILIGKSSGLTTQKRSDLSKVATLWEYPDQGFLDTKRFLSDCLARGIESVFCEGGPGTWTAFLDSGFVDRYYQFIAPKLIRSQAAKSLFQSADYESLDELTLLDLLTVETLDSDILVDAYLKSPLRFQSELL